jgi:hypothetical protein
MIFHGIGINWGISTQIQYAVGLFQTREYNVVANSETITDAGNTSVSKLFWDFREEATFTYVAAGSNSYPGFNNNTGNIAPSYPGIAQFVNLTDSNYPNIVGKWIVDAVSTNSSNLSCMRVTLKLSRYPQIY